MFARPLLGVYIIRGFAKRAYLFCVPTCVWSVFMNLFPLVQRSICARTYMHLHSLNQSRARAHTQWSFLTCRTIPLSWNRTLTIQNSNYWAAQVRHNRILKLRLYAPAWQDYFFAFLDSFWMLLIVHTSALLTLIASSWFLCRFQANLSEPNAAATSG